MPAEAARAAGKAAIDPQVLAGHEDWYHKAAATGIALNADRNGSTGLDALTRLTGNQQS